MVNIDRLSLRGVVERFAGILQAGKLSALQRGNEIQGVANSSSSSSSSSTLLYINWQLMENNPELKGARQPDLPNCQTCKQTDKPVPESIQRSPHLLLIILPSLCLATRPLRRGSAVARLLGMRVRVQPDAWMFLSCECCVLSGIGLFIGLITRLEESYRLWCVWVLYEASIMRRSWHTGRLMAYKKSLTTLPWSIQRTILCVCVYIHIYTVYLHMYIYIYIKHIRMLAACLAHMCQYSIWKNDWLLIKCKEYGRNGNDPVYLEQRC